MNSPASSSAVRGTTTRHLTDQQLAESVDAASPPDGATAAHLRQCLVCADELTEMRKSLALFREASTALAERELSQRPFLQRRPAPAQRRLLRPVWCVAAASVLMAAVVPMELRWLRSSPPAAAVPMQAAKNQPQSDAALLEEIDRELSASVPAPMQALADPTGGASSSTTSTSTQQPKE